MKAHGRTVENVWVAIRRRDQKIIDFHPHRKVLAGSHDGEEGVDIKAGICTLSWPRPTKRRQVPDAAHTEGA